MVTPYFYGCCTGFNPEPGAAAQYRQARSVETDSLVNIWLPVSSLPDSFTTLKFYNPFDGICYYLNSSDSTSTSPGNVIAGWEVLSTSEEEETYCAPEYRQARSCLTDELVDIWDLVVNIPSFPYYFIHGGDVYYFLEADGEHDTPGTLVDSSVTPSVSCVPESFNLRLVDKGGGGGECSPGNLCGTGSCTEEACTTIIPLTRTGATQWAGSITGHSITIEPSTSGTSRWVITRNNAAGTFKFDSTSFPAYPPFGQNYIFKPGAFSGTVVAELLP